MNFWPKIGGKQLGLMLLLFAFAADTAVWGRKINVSIESDPPGAQVFINGESQGTTPLSLKMRTLRPGEGPYNMRLWLEGYDEERFTFDPDRQSPAMKLNLEPLSRVKVFDVITEPSGASIMVDGRHVGTTPIRGREFTFRRADKRAPWSVFQLSIARSDYQTEDRSLRVDDESLVPVELSLLREEKRYLLEARTETGEPLNAEIILNGAPAGTTPLTLPLVFSRSDKAEAWPEFQVDFQIPTIYQTESIVLQRGSMANHKMVLAAVTEILVTFATPEVVATPTGAVYKVVENDFLGTIDTRDTSMHIRSLKRVTAYRRRDRNPGSAFACVNSFTLSPDGQFVIYAVTEKDSKGRYYSKLYRKQASDDTGGITSFTKDSGYLDTNPITRLGSDILLLQSNRSLRRKPDIFQVHVDGAGGFARITGDTRYNFHPAYTDCNRFLVYVSVEADYPFPQPQISTIRCDGTLATQLQVTGLEVNHNHESRIFFVREDENSNTQQIYSMTPDGKLETAMINDQAFRMSNCTHPVVSYDGESVLFVSDQAKDTAERGHHDIYLMDRNGGNLRRLTENGSDDTRPAWSPLEEGVIFFLSNRGGVYNIWRMEMQ